MTNPMIEQAAERLRTAAETRTPCEPVRDLIGDSDLETVYRVPALVTESRCAAGHRMIGRTAAAVQGELGVESPDFGHLFSDMAFADHEPMPLTGFLQPRVEAEVAFVLGRDLDLAGATVADTQPSPESRAVHTLGPSTGTTGPSALDLMKEAS
ncbi:2-keto-4-pentenoate hydratase [Nocardia sp. CA-107356]|uniref:2-keto-4-pentenoate hydratase n=1 Tax=Nocardia sp. CA-107356 TaxID=3239972 RepID=UPI003D9016CB